MTPLRPSAFERTRRGSAIPPRELRLAPALVCGLSAVVLQVTAAERPVAGGPTAEEAPAAAAADPGDGDPAASIAWQRARALAGSAHTAGGPASSPGAPTADDPATELPTTEAARAAAAVAALRSLAAHPLRGPPSFPA